MEDVLHDRLQRLGDVELAILVSLLSAQHCIFSTTQRAHADLRTELGYICNEAFGLQTAVIDCSSKMTVDDFSESLLVDVLDDFEDAQELRDGSGNPTLSVDFHTTRGSSVNRLGSFSNSLNDRRIADVVIAANLDQASSTVQMQALELLRTKRIFTRTSRHTASKDFLFIVVLSSPGARLSHHLHDLFAMSHFHAEEDGLPYLDGTMGKDSNVTFSSADIKRLRNSSAEARITGEIAAYLHNIVVFMRMSRYVKGGVTATATRHLRAVAMALAPLHGVSYVTPSLITLAAKKVYPHRLVLATAETERSLRWGSDPEAVRQLLQGVTVEDVLEDVIASVETPL